MLPLFINQELDCLHEADNPYDHFDIKTCESASGKIDGNNDEMMEISCHTKFLLQRSAVIKVTLSSTNYRKFPLVQGALLIP